MMRMAAALAITFLAVTGVRTAVASGAPVSTRSVEVTDPVLHMTAYRVEVPSSWKFVGTVTMSPGCHAYVAGLQFTMTSPDGSMGYELYPSVQWTSAGGQSKGRNCPPVNVGTAAGFLVNIALPNLRPGANVTAVLPATPERAAQLAQMEQTANATLNQMAGQYGQRNQSHVRVQGARVRFRFESNGREMEGELTGAVNCTDGVSLMGGGGPTRSCYIGGPAFAYAPAGQLDSFVQSAYYTNFAHEMVSNPQWEKRVSDISAASFQNTMRGNQINQGNILAAGQRAGDARAGQHQVDMQNSQSHFDQLQSNYRAQMAGYAQHNAGEAARSNAVHTAGQRTAIYAADQGIFQDPTTGQKFQASSDFNHQWISGDGQTMLQTNDHTYDPNGREGTQGWTELVPR